MQVSARGYEHTGTAVPRITKNVDFWSHCATVAREVAQALNDGPAIARTLEIGEECERLARSRRASRPVG